MKNTEKALIWIVEILEKYQISYFISGGFAARAYGVERPLFDIDIEVADADILKIFPEVREYATFGPDRFKDEQWDLNLLTLQYEGQDIDIAGTDARIFNTHTQKWEKEIAERSTVLFSLYGRQVPVQDMDSLIDYKKKLSRPVDLEDVRQLEILREKTK